MKRIVEQKAFSRLSKYYRIEGGRFIPKYPELTQRQKDIAETYSRLSKLGYTEDQINAYIMKNHDIGKYVLEAINRKIDNFLERILLDYM